jgi:Subtilase family
MGQLSSFFRGRWRAGWLALIIGLAAAVLIVDAALAKSRKRGDDNDNAPGRDSFSFSRDNGSRGNWDNGSRGNFDGGGRASSDGDASARATSSSSGGANSSAPSSRDAGRDSNDRGDHASDKNEKADRKGKDDDDDDGRSGSQRDAGKDQNKGSGGSKGGADHTEPPRTVVEMFQRMFNSPASSGPSNEAKSSNRADADRPAAGTPGDSNKGANTTAAAKKEALPTPTRAATAEGPATRAAQRVSSPALGWLRDARATDLFRRDEILVVNASRAAMAQLNFAHVETIATGTSRLSRFVVPEGLDAIAARQLLREQMPALASGFNYVYRPFVASSEGRGYSPALGQPIGPSPSKACSADRCYGPALIHWLPDSTACSVEIGVGVIDTGFDSQHPAFKDRKINWSTVLEGEHVSVQAWHGTGVLALLSGHPQSSTPGLIPNATFTATNTFYSDAKGQPATDTTTLVKALKLMEIYKVKVVNLSLAGPQDAVLHKQIKDMSETGVLFVAAAGNGGPFAQPSYPAAYPEVIAVTAVDRNLVGYRHATRGPHIDVAAPGVEVWTALPDKREGPQTGTSFAVPYVTAAAAAVYPKDELAYKGRPLDPKKAVLSRLTTRDLGQAGRDTIYGQGLLQAPAKCADKSGTELAPVEVSSAWSPTLQPVVQPTETGVGAGLMSLTPSAEVRWPGVVQHLSFQPDR